MMQRSVGIEKQGSDLTDRNAELVASAAAVETLSDGKEVKEISSLDPFECHDLRMTVRVLNQNLVKNAIRAQRNPAPPARV